MTVPKVARPLALIWLLLTVIAGGYLGVAALRGIAFRTDLLSLLPADAAEQQSHALNGRLLEKAGKRIVILVGHAGQKRRARRCDGVGDGSCGGKSRRADET